MFGILPTFVTGATGSSPPGTFARRAVLQQAGNLTGRRAGSMWKMLGSSSSKITFTDTFTGADGDPPNARWNPDLAGWTIQGNKLQFNGVSYSNIFANCTAGDNDFSFDIAEVGGSAYLFWYIRYIDANNWVAGMRDEADNICKIKKCVASVVTEEAVDPGAGPIGGGANLGIKSVGNLITLSINTTPVCTATIADHTSATNVGIGINSGHTADFIDNAVLA